VKIDEQVCSVELAKRLRDLGAKQDSYFSWYQDVGGYWTLGDPAEVMNNAVDIGRTTAPQFNSASAFTVAELGEMLPAGVFEISRINQKEDRAHPFHVKYDDNDELGPTIYTIECGRFRAREKTEADARAKMLTYLLENGIISASELNGYIC
jgi:hypothetical protein